MPFRQGSCPHDTDSGPALIKLMLAEQAGDRKDARMIDWEDTFLEFDAWGLYSAYDGDFTSYNEIRQIAERSPHRSSARNSARFCH